MDENTRDLIHAMDKRAADQINSYTLQHGFDIGTVEAVTYAGTCVRLGESGRYLRNVTSLQGVDVTIGTRVMCARIGREKWVIVGAIERQGGITPTIQNTNIVAQPQELTLFDRGGMVEANWKASYFNISAYEIQFEGASTDNFRICAVTDNTQFFLHPAVTPSIVWLRVRAVGPQWQRGGVTDWASLPIASDDLTDYLLTDGTRDPTGPIEMYRNDAVTVSGLTPEVGAVAFDTDNQRLGIYSGSMWLWINTTGMDPYRVGPVTPVGVAEPAGYGTKLYFSGGPQLGFWNSDNSDPLFIARYNVASDQTELRINIGDNLGTVDALVIGYTTAGTWYPVYRFETQKQAHIINADGTLADITTKFNTLLSELEAIGIVSDT